MSRKMY